MELKRENGFINLDNVELTYSKEDIIQTFIYKDKKYFFKIINDKKDIYNELIAEELANDFGISCAHYDIARRGKEVGVISEDFIKNQKYTNFIEILYAEYLEDYKNRDTNNLYDIWNALSKKYNNQEVVYKLMNQITDIFIYDLFIGNTDRHDGNMGILETEDGINIAPIFDNSLIFRNPPNYVDVLKTDEDIERDWHMELLKFLSQSSMEYQDRIKGKLWVIDDDNIESVINRVEKRIDTKINNKLKEKIMTFFKIRKTEIDKILNEFNKRKKVR